jgi:FAD/FMN-containing dehydrogenase
MARSSGRRGIDGLRAAVAGEVVAAGDSGYEAAGRTLIAQGKPLVVVRCAVPADIAAALGYAEAHELPVAVRSGGHHVAGFGTNDGGIVIDVGPMNDIESVSDDGVVRIGTGATWGQVAARLGEDALAFSSGDTAGVGVGGLLAGGGIGWMVRKHGLAIDNVVAAEVVTADGSVRRVDAATEPELFWGLRGAAGSLGVVTSYDLTAVRQPTVHFGTLLFPWTQAEQVLAGWTDYLATAPEALSSSLQLPPTMMADRQAPIAVMVCVAGDAAGRNPVLEPLRGLGTVLTDTVVEVPYAQVFSNESMPGDWTPRVRNGLFDQWPADFGGLLMAARMRMPALAVEIRALGGAFGAMPAEATAFGHREARFMVNSALIGSTGLHGAQVPDFEWLWEALAPERAYANFLSHPTAADVDRCYPPAHRSRLAALKQAVDPADVFHTTLTVPPADRIPPAA